MWLEGTAQPKEPQGKEQISLETGIPPFQGLSLREGRKVYGRAQVSPSTKSGWMFCF